VWVCGVGVQVCRVGGRVWFGGGLGVVGYQLAGEAPASSQASMRRVVRGGNGPLHGSTPSHVALCTVRC